MKNNKGFTLVEIISVVVLLGIVIIITVPSVMNASKNTKIKTLNTKIDNIESAAVLYGQDRRENFTLSCKESGEICNGIDGECMCYQNKITVDDLIDPNSDGDLTDGYIKADGMNENGINFISNPTNEEKYLNSCEIQIYKKYGKIYAIYLNNNDADIGTDCWKQE